MGVEEVILAAVVADVAVNSPHCLSPYYSSVQEKQGTHKAATLFEPLPTCPETVRRQFDGRDLERES